MYLEWRASQVGGPRTATISFRTVGQVEGMFAPFSKDLAEEYRSFFRASMRSWRDRLQEQIDGIAARPRYGGTHFNVYYRISAPQIYFGVTVSDPDFFYKEWDTKPHWPPFGRGTDLHNWAIAQGWLTPGPRGGWRGAWRLFGLARSMAPLEGGRRWISSRGNWVGYETGEGGRPIGRNDRKVATAGGYAVTNAVNSTATDMWFWMTDQFNAWFEEHGL